MLWLHIEMQKLNGFGNKISNRNSATNVVGGREEVSPINANDYSMPVNEKI